MVLKTIVQYFERNVWFLYVIAIILVFPALLINLGLFPLTSDEHIRGLVALEMLISDNYTVPTIYGEYYLKKPPLFNWIIIGYTYLFGNFEEFTLRLPTVVSTLLYGLTIYFIIKKHYNSRFAFVNAIVFVTCGRMLFWDTQLALIDTTFSWVVFVNFMIIYNLFQKGKYWQLFIDSYILTAVGYMFKGLPAIVFQGTTLLVFFLYKRKFLKLISWQHAVGILTFLVLVGIYYFFYMSQFPGTLDDVISILFEQSTRRTIIRFGWERTIHHFIQFPLNMLYHFAPWSFLIIFILDLKLFARFFIIKKCRVFTGLFLVSLVSYFILYESYPHLTLLLIPITILLFLGLYKTVRDTQLLKDEKIQIRYSFIAISISIPLIALSFFVVEISAFFKIIQYVVSLLLFALIAFSLRFVIKYHEILKEPFVKYNAIIFFVNIIVYWTSPEVHPRYLLMLAPMIFLVFLHFYDKYRKQNHAQVKFIEIVFLVFSIIATLGVWSLPFLKETRDFPLIYLKTMVLFIGLAFFTILYFKVKTQRFLIFGIILLIVRIGFNWSVLEARGVLAHEIVAREAAVKTGQMMKDNELFIYKKSWIDDFSAFYITRERMYLLQRKHDNFNSSEYYLVDTRHDDEIEFDSIYEFRIVWEKKLLKLVRLKEETENQKEFDLF